ncbi:MAG TPA: hypothetical protein VMH32_00490 [Burkholderiales bacterium]|nr:hypothetical protein [Burkholderiales bacterium]
MKQMCLAGSVYRTKGKKTKRETFLAEMDKIVPWESLPMPRLTREEDDAQWTSDFL